MSAEDKIALLKQLFHQVSNYGVHSWGDIDTGYRWTCDSHSTAVHLAETLFSNIEILKLDPLLFPYRYDPVNKGILIIEPVADPE
jgi:hypothetical protein